MMTPVSRALPSVPADRAEPTPSGSRFRVAPVEARAEAPPAAALPAGPLSAATPAAESGAARVLTRLLEDERAVDRGLARALRGGAMSPQELLALQVNVIRYSQELEVASRIVDKVTGAVKQTLQTQV
jgi:hypothetical protein